MSWFKYLEVHIDSDLGWRTQVTSVCTRVHQHLHFLRRFKTIWRLYRAAIESIFRHGMTSWFGNLTVKSKVQISSLVRTAGKIMGPLNPASLNPQELFEQAICSQARNILTAKTHVLYPEYRLMNSGRRFRVEDCIGFGLSWDPKEILRERPVLPLLQAGVGGQKILRENRLEMSQCTMLRKKWKRLFTWQKQSKASQTSGINSQLSLKKMGKSYIK